jgi:hypothetical protein
MLQDKQGGRLVFELLASLRADLDSERAALGTAAFRLRQLVRDLFATKFLGCLGATVTLMLLWLWANLGRDWLWNFRRRLERIGKEQWLVRVKTFGARAVQAPNQALELMAQVFLLMLGIPQELEQLADHLLEHDGVIGQWTRHVER